MYALRCTLGECRPSPSSSRGEPQARLPHVATSLPAPPPSQPYVPPTSHFPQLIASHDCPPSVEPALGRLRDMYASVGGTLVTATLVREPIAHLFSAWYMWPPLGGNETQPADFATWAEGTEAAQAGLLVRERRDVMHTRFAPKARGNLKHDDAVVARHFKLMNHQIAQVRTAFGVALALNRTPAWSKWLPW